MLEAMASALAREGLHTGQPWEFLICSITGTYLEPYAADLRERFERHSESR